MTFGRLTKGILWAKSPKVHHAFRLTDEQSGRILNNSLEIHTLELGWCNGESGFANGQPLGLLGFLAATRA